MRRPRDIDSELLALDAKAKQLRARKVAQFGELVIACKADALPVELLAGALIEVSAERDAARKEAWRGAGAAMFRESRRSARSPAASDSRGAPADSSGALPLGAPAQPR